MNLDNMPVKAMRAALVTVVSRRMGERLGVIIPAFRELRVHLAARRDVNALGLAEIEGELEFLLEDAKLLGGIP